ncbi:MAG: hypothetical protein EOM52_10620 [Clostridia bacterium]|nr:hypothetical protein [Clostridia bacterium]
MKKLISLTLGAALAVSLLAGCSSNQKPAAQTPAPATPAPTAQTGGSTEPVGGALKTGLAIVGDAAKSVAPADGKNGTAQMDTTVVAVLVDENGVIADCKIDGVQTKVEFDATGKLVTALEDKIPSKNEIGTGYGMGKASSIGKEWNEQAAALAAYVVGKTVDDVKGIAMDETTKPTDAELATSVTMSIGGILPAIEKAVANAQDLGAQTGDKLGLGVDTNIAKSKDAGEKDGLAQAYGMYAAASFNADGKITSCLLDGSQTNVNFNTKGEITSDIAAAVQSKNELKEAYDMKKASSIGKEWYEQAAAYAAYATGKTVAEVNGVALDETGHATDADLAASVTISVGTFNACLDKAAANAG